MKDCACGKQVVWYFDNPTVIVCESCEMTINYRNKECPNCGGELSYFVKEEE